MAKSSSFSHQLAIAAVLLSPILAVTSFQSWKNPLRILHRHQQPIPKALQPSHNNKWDLFAKRKDEFTNDGSRKAQRGFGSPKQPQPQQRNGAERNITSVKDVDAALNDEIEGALKSAEADLAKGSGAGAVGTGTDGKSDDAKEARVENVEAEVTKAEKSPPAAATSKEAVGNTVKLPKKEEPAPMSKWDSIKETVYEAADSAKAKLNPPPNFAADFTPVPPETPGEKAMKQWSSIDVTSSDVAAEDIVSEEERMLLEAQREAEEAQALLLEAEEEAARIEKELALLPLLEDEVEIEEDLPPESMGGDFAIEEEEEEDALTSMASAYQAALDAANDNVNLLSSQIEELEKELESETFKMDVAKEDKERVSAEYAYLASNYKEYKEQMDGKVESLQEEIEMYQTKIGSLNEEISKMRTELASAREEAQKWKNDYESIQKEMAEQLSMSLAQQEELQATLDDVTSTLETSLLASQKEYQSSLDTLTTEYDASLAESKKTIEELETSLRDSRAEAERLSVSSKEDRVRAVDDVRQTMNEEVEKLRETLKGLEGQSGENEQMVEKVRLEKEELLGEIEELKKAIEEEKSKLASSSDEYSLTLEAYAKKEDELNTLIQSKDDNIDILAEQIKTMKAELQSFEDRGEDAKELAAANAELNAELERVRSALQGEKASLEQKAASLEQDLLAKQKLADTTQRALDETMVNFNSVKEQFENEQKAAAVLQTELKSAEAKLVDMELSSKTTANEQEMMAAREKRELQIQIETIGSQLKAATERAARAEQDIKMYEDKLRQLASQLAQSKTGGEALAKNLDETREQLKKEQQTVGKLQAELKSAQAKLVDMELSSKSTASEREAAVATEKRELQIQIEKLSAELKATTERAVKGEEKIKLYEERVQSITSQLSQSEASVEKLKQELASVREKAQAAVKQEAEKNKQLQSQLTALKDEMNSSLAKADAEIKKRNDALQSKESLQTEMQTKMAQLQNDVNTARAAATTKSEEAKSLQELVQKLKSDLAKEARLREDVSKGKEGLESLLQKKLNELQKEIDDTRADAEKLLQKKNDELKQIQDMVASLKADAVKSNQQKEEAIKGKESLEATLKSQIAQLEKELRDVKAKADAAISTRNAELTKMEGIITKLKAEVIDEKRLKDEALKDKADLDAALQKKMAQLQADASAASKNTDGVVQAKEKELVELNAVIAKLKNEIQKEVELKNEAIKSRESAESSLKSKIDQLLRDITANRAKSEEAIRFKDDELKKREAAVSTLKADLSKLMKVKDDALKDRDSLDKELSNQVIQLKNTLGSTKLKAESVIAAEVKAKEVALQTNSELEAKIGALEKDLISMRNNANAELGQMETLVANLRKKIDSASKEKSDLESKLQANIKQIQVSADAAVKAKTEELNKMNELASNLKNELSQQRMRVTQLEELQAKTATSQIKAQSVAAPVGGSSIGTPKGAASPKTVPQKATAATQPADKSGRGFANVRSQSAVAETTAKISASASKGAASPKAVTPPTAKSGQGFAKDTKKAASEVKSAQAPSVMSSTPEEIEPVKVSPEQAEIERISRLKAAEEAKKLSESKRAESKRVTAALDQLTNKSSSPPVAKISSAAKPLEAEEKPTSAKVYVGTKPKYVRVESKPVRQTVSLKDLIKGKGVGATNAFPDRKEAPAPSSQAKSQPSKEAAQKGSTLKTIVTNETVSSKNSFPERKGVSPPSSQAPMQQMKQGSEQGSSLKTVMIQNTAKSSNNAFPDRKEAPAPSSQAPTPAATSTNDSEQGQSLKKVMAKDTKSSTNAFPERKVAPSPSSQAPKQNQSASGDHIKEGLTLRRYTQTKKASTPLGRMLADEASTGPPTQSVPVPVKKSPSTESDTAVKPAKGSSSFANLASLVGNSQAIANRDRSTVNQARTSTTKLGDIAKDAKFGVGAPTTEVPSKATTSKSVGPTTGQPKETTREVEKKQAVEKKKAAPIDNKDSAPDSKKAASPEKAAKSSPGNFSNLSSILQSRDSRSTTPTINRDRASVSLFPEKSGSALSRLLRK